MNLNPLTLLLKPITLLLEQNLREQVAIRQGLQLLLSVHGVAVDLQAGAAEELGTRLEELSRHKPYGPQDTIQTDDSRAFVDEILGATGDDTEKMLLELEQQAPEVAEQLRAYIGTREDQHHAKSAGPPGWERSR